MMHMIVIPGKYTLNGCKKLNAKRLFNLAYKSTEKSKLRRRVIRGKAKQKDDKPSELEGSSYEGGAF